ncbi:MAG: hypothetical protein KGN16_21650 [Burkholderiales bacterium]|nr:hypothetical protein [Burkholderiales bacterium]
MTGPRDDSSRNEAQRAGAREDLLAPRTQIVTDRDDYLGQDSRDIGRRIADDQVELFVSTDVAQALQAEFTRQQPEFVALHDVGSSASLRLLTSLAGPAGARVQRLSIRRQGHGVALAVLQFVEAPLADGTPVRVYSTETDAEGPARNQIAKVLLAHSRLGVLLVGPVVPHALTAQLAPLRDALQRASWPNRDLLMVPLGSGTALAAQATQLAGQSGVAVHVTPHASRPRQVWTFIGGAWNRLHGGTRGERALSTDIAQVVAPRRVPNTEAETQPMELDAAAAAAAAPSVMAAATLPAAAMAPPPPKPRPALAPQPMPRPGGRTDWQDYVDRCAAIKGALSCCVFDMHTVKPLAHAGGLPAADRLAQQGALLLTTMNDAARSLGMGASQAEAAITVAGHHLLLRPVPGHPGIVVHLVLSATTGNVTLARMQLERVEPPQ